MQPTDLTVSAVIERDGQYLMVEEITSGAVVLNQPGGHLETGESPEEAVIREVLEETGCDVACGELVGIYLWIHPQSRQQFLRIVYVASLLNEDESRPLDDGIIAKRWLSRADIEYRPAHADRAALHPGFRGRSASVRRTVLGHVAAAAQRPRRNRERRPRVIALARAPPAATWPAVIKCVGYGVRSFQHR
jgi:8-oxo-dGTP pyrophosphatase MutT (NUDIX family)